MGIFANELLLLRLFTFVLNLNHASYKPRVLFLFSSKHIIGYFSTILHIVLLCGRFDTGNFLQNFGDMFSMTGMYFAEVFKVKNLCITRNIFLVQFSAVYDRHHITGLEI
jgi:hypothetical protein